MIYLIYAGVTEVFLINDTAMNNIPYRLTLHSIDGLGPIRLRKIIDYFKDPKLAWEADGQEFRNLGIPANIVEGFLKTRQTLNPDQHIEAIHKSGIKWLTVYDKDYPANLKQIYDPPTVLYYKGEILPIDQKAVAVVGTRKITGYGIAVTEKFTRDLVAAGLTIISGLARGVDSTAHKQTIDSEGRTLAIL